MPDPKTAGAQRCDATIAICTYNRVATLGRTLKSLHGLRGPYNFEVLVVNGPSDDGTAELLAQHSDIRVFDNPEINLASSRNIAIRHAAGRYIAFIDDDAVPEPDWLTLILDRMEAEDDIAATGGFIRSSDGIAFQDKYVFADAFGRGVKCDNPDYLAFDPAFENHYPSLTGTNVVFRLETLRSIGGFDEVFAYFLDETDVNKRMHDAGLRSVVLPDAEVHHKFAESHLRNEQRVATNMFPTARSIAYFALKHGVPAAGWSASVDRIKQFLRDELAWKSELLALSEIDTAQFDALMDQVAKGATAGIDAYFDGPEAPMESAPEAATAPPKAPVIRTMNAEDTSLRLCMLARDHARSRMGGISRWTTLVARGLAERGHEVTVIGELKKPAVDEHVGFTDAGYWSHIVGDFEREHAAEADCLGLPPRLADIAKRKRTEVLRVMPRRRFQLASAPIWDVEGAALIGERVIPTVLSLHTCAGLMLESSSKWRENEKFYRNHVLRVIGAEMQALKRCDFILANSEAILRDISSLYDLDLADRPHAIVPHGLDDIEAPEGLLGARIAEQEDQPDSRPVRVLFLGRLESRKGIEEVAVVAEQLLAAGRRVKFDIVGETVDDDMAQHAHALAAAYPDSVALHGHLDHAELDGLMRRADVFFAPSLYESFGLIYIEAFRYSLPSVAYAVGGVPEVVTTGVNGLLAPLNDRAALREALDSLIRDSELRHRLSLGARRSFEERFGYALMAERLEEVYRGVVEADA